MLRHAKRRSSSHLELGLGFFLPDNAENNPDLKPPNPTASAVNLKSLQLFFILDFNPHFCLHPDVWTLGRALFMIMHLIWVMVSYMLLPPFFLIQPSISWWVNSSMLPIHCFPCLLGYCCGTLWPTFPIDENGSWQKQSMYNSQFCSMTANHRLINKHKKRKERERKGNRK